MMAMEKGKTFDLRTETVRDLNRYLHGAENGEIHVRHPDGAHNIACGLTAPLRVIVEGHAGYYCGGMNELADILIEGLAGPGVAENMMSGKVAVRGNASQCAAASARGGLLVVGGDAAARCGISLKGGDIVVKGDAAAMVGFLSQKGRIVIVGDAGENLGDSLYESRIYVRGRVASLGTDCVEKELRAEHLAELGELLEAADCNADPSSFRRYGSARMLYHFTTDHV